jgi:hypothetical protein
LACGRTAVEAMSKPTPTALTTGTRQTAQHKRTPRPAENPNGTYQVLTKARLRN